MGVRFFVFFVRGSSCLGLLVYLLARSGAILGSIFGLWGCLGLCFEGSGGPVGGFGGPWGPLWPPRRPKVKFSHFLSLPFWGHFGCISELKIDAKSDVIFCWFSD